MVTGQTAEEEKDQEFLFWEFLFFYKSLLILKCDSPFLWFLCVHHTQFVSVTRETVTHTRSQPPKDTRSTSTKEEVMDTKSMSLASILDAFKGPVNEEQTWAICYQVMSHVQEMVSHKKSTSQEECSKSSSESQEESGNDQGSSAAAASCINHVHRHQSNDDGDDDCVQLLYPRLDESSQIVLRSDGSISLDSVTSHVNEKEVINCH